MMRDPSKAARRVVVAWVCDVLSSLIEDVSEVDVCRDCCRALWR